jgi:O-antigen ligase
MSRGTFRINEPLDEKLGFLIEVLLLGGLALALLLFGAVRATELAWVSAAVLGATGLWLVRLWLNPSHRLLLHPVLLPVVGFVGYAVWRASWAPVQHVAWQEIWVVLIHSLLFVVALHNLHGQDAVQRTCTVLVALGAGLSLYAIGQYLSQSESVLWLMRPAQYFRRGGATFVNPNHLAGLLVLLLPIALAQTFVGRTRGPVRVFHGYAGAMMLGGLAVTMSRGGWLAGGAVVTGFFGWLLLRRRQLRIPALIGLGIALGAAFFFFKFNSKARQRIDGVQVGGTEDSGDRFPLWRPAYAMWRDHVWTGVGPGHFDIRFSAYREPAIQTHPGYAHNEYLNTLADYGMIGGGLAGLAVLLLGMGVVLSRKYVERGPGDLGDKGSNRTAFYVGSTLGLGGFGIHCGGEFLLHIPGLAMAAVLMAALLASTVRFATERWWHTPTWWSRLGVSAPILAALVWLGPTMLNGFREGRYLNRAALAAQVGPGLMTDLKAASAIAPGNPRTAYEIGENQRRLSFVGESRWREEAKESIEWLEKAAALNPFDPNVHLSLGLAWYWLGDAAKSAAAFEESYRLGPNLVVVTNHYAWNLLQQGRVREARALFEKSLEWNSWDNWFARRHLDDIRSGIWKEFPSGVGR